MGDGDGGEGCWWWVAMRSHWRGNCGLDVLHVRRVYIHFFKVKTKINWLKKCPG